MRRPPREPRQAAAPGGRAVVAICLDWGMSDAQSMTQHTTAGSTDDNHHGNTPAAWVTVAIIAIASIIGTLAVILGNWPLFWGAIALAVVGAIVGKVMQALGYGQPSLAKRARR